MSVTEYYQCDYTNKEIRKRVYTDGSTHFVEQCTRCGTQGRSFAKKSLEVHRALANGGIPDFDEELRDRFTGRAYDAMARERERQSAEWWAEYHRYMNSPEWLAKREKVLERDNYVCQGCGENTATQVHHKSYAHFGDELLWELVSVCRECHDKVKRVNREMAAGVPYVRENAFGGA